MKNGKRWLLLSFCLCLTLSLFSCGRDGEAEESDTVSDSSTSVETEVPDGVSPQEPTHEMFRYFVLEDDSDPIEFIKSTQYKGDVVDVDRENHLLALHSQELDVRNMVTDRISVYHMLTGELIREETVTNPFGTDEKTELTLEIDYPVLRVIRRSEAENGTPIYEVAHYLAKKDGALLHTTNRYIPKEQSPKIAYGNGLVSYNMGDTVTWIDRDMETVRTVDAIANAGYEVTEFQSEYQGYLYTWNKQTLQIFNRLGVCSGTYTITHEGELNVHVLDNGNVLIQDLEKVDAHTSAHLILENTRYRLTSLIMNYLDGSTRVVELDFLVDTLETAYAQRYGETGSEVLPFRLASGYDNQAILYRFANGRMSVYQEYAVLSNDLAVLYSVKNNTEGVFFGMAFPVGEELYQAPVIEGGSYHFYIFDADGTPITPAGTLTVTKSYLVSEWGIYDHRMNRIYDLSEGEFAGSYFQSDRSSDRVYLKRYNFTTGAEEAYVFDGEGEAPRLLCDGVSSKLYLVGEGYYVLRDPATDQYRFCRVDGEVRLIVYGEPEVIRCEDALLVCSEFEGDTMVCVIR